MKHTSALIVTSLAVLLIGTGCQSKPVSETATTSESRQADAPFYVKPGFQVEAEDGRLWVLKPGEKKSGKHVTLIGAGPQRMTVKAVSNDTALEYLATKQGFEVEVVDGRLWVLKPGEKKSGKHVTLIGAGPKGMTLKALSNDTALEYLATKQGFEVEVVDGRLWVLKPGEKKSGKHVTLIGAGPKGMTLKALTRDVALEYLASKPGYHIEVEDGRLWVFKPGEKKSGKHVTRIGVGPQNTTMRALDMETLEAYLAYQP